jgi:hypothetical protein
MLFRVPAAFEPVRLIILLLLPYYRLTTGLPLVWASYGIDMPEI